MSRVVTCAHSVGARRTLGGTAWSAEVYPEMVFPVPSSPDVAGAVSADSLKRLGGMAELYQQQPQERGGASF